MRRIVSLTVCIAFAFAFFSCSKKKSEPAVKKTENKGTNVSSEIKIPPAAISLHYRLPGHHLALKKAVEPLSGPSIQFLWPHLESVQSFSAWIFEMPAPVPGKMTPPRFVACLKGKATEWLYTGVLQKPEGGAITFVKDQIVPVQGPQGAHETYYLLDAGQHACLGSTEALARDALRWPEPAFGAADSFLKIRLDIALLSKMAKHEAFAPMLASLRALWALYRIDVDQVAKIISDMDSLELDLALDAGVGIRQSYDVLWKNAPSFLQNPKPDRIPFTKHTLLDVHFEMNGGQWMGIDIWPLIEAQNPPQADGFADKLKVFVLALQSVDFQLASNGSSAGARIVISAPGQAEFLLEMAQKMFDAARRDEKVSIKTISEDEKIWEIHPTAAASADIRTFLQLYTGGKLRLAYRQQGDASVWTLGEWPETNGKPQTPVNIRISFAMLPFLNLFLPVMKNSGNSDSPFVPYPSIEQDPWTVDVVLHPEHKRISAQSTMPLGAWLNAMQKYPEIFKRIQGDKKNAPARKTKPESDL